MRDKVLKGTVTARANSKDSVTNKVHRFEGSKSAIFLLSNISLYPLGMPLLVPFTAILTDRLDKVLKLLKILRFLDCASNRKFTLA